MMSNNIICPTCGAIMTLQSLDKSSVCYKCDFCGQILHNEISDEQGDLLYSYKKSELIRRIHMGLVDWETTQWHILYKEIIDFIGRYEAAKTDIQLQIGVVACITSGFQLLDDEKYKQCKLLFKVTEKMYKQQVKMLKQQSDTKLHESVSDYKDLRAKYKKCRNEYRNTKLIWKAVFFVFRKAAFQ